MRVVVHPADEGGCGHYRLIFPATVLAQQGADVVVTADAYRAVWQPSVFGDRIVDLADTVDADVVVLQRPMHRNKVELIDALQARGVAVVVEIDDDFHALHRRNPAWSETNPLTSRDMNRDWLMRACGRADLVTCTTAAIAARYGGHGRVAVLPNLVPAWYLQVERERLCDEVVVGWTGSVSTHPGDLNVTLGGVAAAVDETDAVFAVVGTGEGVQKALQLAERPVTTGWLPIALYPRAMAAFDVGIVPLTLSAFNDAKSWLKMLEFAALGVPVVASPTSPNQALYDVGVGVLTNDSRGWQRHVASYAKDEQLRAEVAGRGRAAAASLTYEAHAERWLDAWGQARANADARRLVAA